jgi:uncharacterized membrane protein
MTIRPLARRGLGLARLHWPLAIASLTAVALLVARARLAHNGTFLFLAYNLVLAWIPLPLAHAAVWASKRGHVLWSLLLAGAWLAWLPNAPYLVTDLLHFHARPPVPVWLDLLLLVQFAWLGMTLGIRSLSLVHSEVERRWGALVGWSVAAICLGATSFGIYLGRFDRWNSWSMLTQPFALAADVAHKMRHPFQHRATYAFTVVCFAFLLLSYLMAARARSPRAA